MGWWRHMNVNLLCDITMAPKQKQQMQKRSEWKEMPSIFISKSVFAVPCVILFIGAAWDSPKSGMRLTWESFLLKKVLKTLR